MTVRTGSWVAAAAFVGPGVELAQDQWFPQAALCSKMFPRTSLCKAIRPEWFQQSVAKLRPSLNRHQLFARQNKQN